MAWAVTPKARWLHNWPCKPWRRNFSSRRNPQSKNRQIFCQTACWRHTIASCGMRGKKGCLIRRAQRWLLLWCKKGMPFGCIAVIHGCMLCEKEKFCCVRAITAIWSKESFLRSKLKISTAMYSLLAWARPVGQCLMFLCPCACSKKTGSCCAPMAYGQFGR